MTPAQSKRLLVIAAAALGAGLAVAAWQASRPVGVPAGPSGSATNADMLRKEEAPALETEDVAYFEDRVGYFARPKAEGAWPGVVMIHEWWGLNANIKDMARQLAAEGYMVLAVDLFGSVAATPEEARTQVGGLDQVKALENMKAAQAFLRNRGAPKLASLGWCFGGGQSLQLALADGLDATVIYYGQLETDPERLEGISWPVLGIFGEEDQSVKIESVRAFEAALDQADVENEIHVYPGVGHAFANPSGANYAPQETADAWAKTLTFLEEALKRQE